MSSAEHANGNPLDDMVIYQIGAPLPDDIRATFLSAGGNETGGALLLPARMFILLLSDITPRDISAFLGPAVMRMARETNCMVLSLLFSGLSYDMVWSPHTARRTGEPRLAKPDPGEHMLFTFILVDETCVIRAIRSSSVAPQMGQALVRAHRELLAEPHTNEAINATVAELFARYPKKIPDERFHEISHLGE
ncbi:hypothetical protein [Pararhodobacter sp.]|uniref:hypothetical protein n=1 Tax=Pararhodobacter sp. TaxID=2127056 RepID=UPI002FDE7515